MVIPLCPKTPCRPHTGNTQWSMWVCLLTWDCLLHYNFHNMAYKKISNPVKWGVELKMNWLNWSILISSGFQFQFNSYDSQIPIGIVASGSRDWSAEQQLTQIAHCKQGAACDTGTLGLVWLTARLSVRGPNWSALVNHIGIHTLTATQPTLIGHALHIKPRPSQFSVPHVPPCMHGNGEIFVCNI